MHAEIAANTMFDCAEVYSAAFRKASPASKLTIQMDADPHTVNPVKLNPEPDSGALE